MTLRVVEFGKTAGRIVLARITKREPDAAQVRREAAVHPLVWERSIETLPWQHVLVFRRRE